jgi:hypothetical protein
LGMSAGSLVAEVVVLPATFWPVSKPTRMPFCASNKEIGPSEKRRSDFRKKSYVAFRWDWRTAERSVISWQFFKPYRRSSSLFVK